MAKWEVKGVVATPADVTALIARAQDLADLQEKMDQANRPESHRPMINCLRACAAALADATQRAEAAEERATRAELEADNWSRDYRALEKAVCGDTGLSAMLIATQAMLFKPRAEAADARVVELTAKLEEAREALRPFADIGIGSDPDYQPSIRMDRAAIVAARVAVEMDGASMPDKINWRYDPAAIVEDDEPMIRRDYE